MDDLKEYLFECAFSHNFGVIQIYAEKEYESFADKSRNLIIINNNVPKKEEIPFIIGHEIGHLMISNSGILYFQTVAGRESEERQADLYSLNLIYDYAAKKYDCFEEPYYFMQAYGIPYRMLNETCKLFKEKSDLIF